MSCERSKDFAARNIWPVPHTRYVLKEPFDVTAVRIDSSWLKNGEVLWAHAPIELIIGLMRTRFTIEFLKEDISSARLMSAIAEPAQGEPLELGEWLIFKHDRPYTLPDEEFKRMFKEAELNDKP